MLEAGSTAHASVIPGLTFSLIQAVRIWALAELGLPQAQEV
jgi:hypothetical protein